MSLAQKSYHILRGLTPHPALSVVIICSSSAGACSAKAQPENPPHNVLIISKHNCQLNKVHMERLHAGPCYRCLFPEAPMAQSCARCSDAGVLGPVPGVIGTLQALEVVKLAAQVMQLHLRGFMNAGAFICQTCRASKRDG